MRSRPSSSQSSFDSRDPNCTETSCSAAVLGRFPKRRSRPPSGRWGGPGDRSHPRTTRQDRCHRATGDLNASKRSCSSAQTRDRSSATVFPSPTSSHNDSMSRIERPRTNPPIINVFKGSVRNSRLQCHFGNSLETNGDRGVAGLRDLDPQAHPQPVCRCRGRNPLRFPPVVLQATSRSADAHNGHGPARHRTPPRPPAE